LKANKDDFDKEDLRLSKVDICNHLEARVEQLNDAVGAHVTRSSGHCKCKNENYIN
jgi:hypothetical protein